MVFDLESLKKLELNTLDCYGVISKDIGDFLIN